MSEGLAENVPLRRRYPAGLYLAITANLFFFTGFQWTFATVPGYLLDIGGRASQIGLAYGLFSLSAVASRPAVGWLVDRWGRKPVLLMGAAIFSLSPALYAMIQTLWPFLAVRILHGFGIAAFTTAYTTLVADLAPRARRGEAIGLSGVTNNFGMLFAPVLGGLAASEWGYANHFWASAGITALSVLLLLPVREPRGEPNTGPKEHSLWGMARLRPVVWASFGITGLAVSYGAILSFLAPFAGERGLVTAGGYFTAFAVAMMIAQACAGWLSDRIGRRAVAVPGMVLVVLAMVSLALAAREASLLVAGALFGLSWGLARAGVDTAVVDAVPTEARGTAVGFLYLCFDVGVGVGSFGLGVLAQAFGFSAAFYAAASWATVTLVAYVAGQRRVTTRADVPDANRSDL